MAKSWVAATIAIVASLIVYFGLVMVMPSPLSAELVWGVPVIGAGVGAFVAPRHKFNVGAVTFIPAILLIGAASYFAGRMGVGDFVGLQGTTIGMVLSLPFIVGASVVGALLGEWASKRRADA
jgi:hypothetical protein